MKYMLLLCRDEPTWAQMSLPERKRMYEDMVVLSDDLAARGQFLGGNPLLPSSSATSVRVRDGKRLVTDGPYAETREQLGGYILIDVDDGDALGLELPSEHLEPDVDHLKRLVERRLGAHESAPSRILLASGST